MAAVVVCFPMGSIWLDALHALNFRTPAVRHGRRGLMRVPVQHIKVPRPGTQITSDLRRSAHYPLHPSSTAGCSKAELKENLLTRLEESRSWVQWTVLLLSAALRDSVQPSQVTPLPLSPVLQHAGFAGHHLGGAGYPILPPTHPHLSHSAHCMGNTSPVC